jgi:hypothetical protein
MMGHLQRACVSISSDSLPIRIATQFVQRKVRQGKSIFPVGVTDEWPKTPGENGRNRQNLSEKTFD